MRYILCALFLMSCGVSTQNADNGFTVDYVNFSHEEGFAISDVDFYQFTEIANSYADKLLSCDYQVPEIVSYMPPYGNPAYGLISDYPDIDDGTKCVKSSWDLEFASLLVDPYCSYDEIIQELPSVMLEWLGYSFWVSDSKGFMEVSEDREIEIFNECISS